MFYTPEEQQAIRQEIRIEVLPGCEEVFCSSPYLRESIITSSTRQASPGRHRYPGRLIAYAVLRPEARGAQPRTFLRRVWWLKEYDPYPEGYPCEAVILPVRAGVESRRAGGGQGGP